VEGALVGCGKKLAEEGAHAGCGKYHSKGEALEKLGKNQDEGKPLEKCEKYRTEGESPASLETDLLLGIGEDRKQPNRWDFVEQAAAKLMKSEK
jgi:hypothetical protein